MSTPLPPLFTRLVVLEAEGSGENEERGDDAGNCDAWWWLTFLTAFIFPVYTATE